PQYRFGVGAIRLPTFGRFKEDDPNVAVPADLVVNPQLIDTRTRHRFDALEGQVHDLGGLPNPPVAELEGIPSNVHAVSNMRPKVFGRLQGRSQNPHEVGSCQRHDAPYSRSVASSNKTFLSHYSAGTRPNYHIFPALDEPLT